MEVRRIASTARSYGENNIASTTRSYRENKIASTARSYGENKIASTARSYGENKIASTARSYRENKIASTARSYGERDVLIDLDDDVLLFDGDGEGVGDVGSFFAFVIGCVNVLAAFDVDFVSSDTTLGRTPPRLSGFDVEFPAVPGPPEALAFAGVVIGAWRWRL